MLNYLRIIFLTVFAHPWDLHQKIGRGRIRFWLIERYNNLYHEINDEVISWRRKQIEKHTRILRTQDQSARIIRDRDKACRQDVDPMSSNYPDNLFYRRW